MKYGRAQEIVASPETIEVLYNGTPVWIERLNPETRTARVSSNTFPEGERDIPVTELIEG